MKKHLSAPGLLQAVYRNFCSIKDPLGSKTEYPLSSCLMSGLAMFKMKFSSMLQFVGSMENEALQFNLKTLYHVEKVPSDTYMRERLDRVHPSRCDQAYKSCFRACQRGGVLPLFHFLDEYVLVSCDGTGYFHSKKVLCDQRCTKHHRDGSISYEHHMMCGVMVHPDQSVVIPLGIEPIIQQKDTVKNDCERQASKRFLSRLRSMHPFLKMVIVEDALHAHSSHIEHLKSLDYQYILNVKRGSHKWLFDCIERSYTQHKTYKKEGVTYQLRWCNHVQLNDSSDTKVNFLECVEINAKNKERRFCWITSFKVDENNVFDLMKGGRSRWKIENETFNTLKKQGYNFEHNYGHGYQHLSTILAHLMMIAFTIDQIEQLCCPLFQKALKANKRKCYLWEKMRGWIIEYHIDTWEIFYKCLVKKNANIKLADLFFDSS